MSRTSRMRAMWIASGSATSMHSARCPSVGSCRHSAANAGSRDPAVEGVGVVGHQVRELGVGIVVAYVHRSREAAQQRRHRLLVHAAENEAVLGLGDAQHGAQRAVYPQLPENRAGVEREGQVLAVSSHQPGCEWNDGGELLRL